MKTKDILQNEALKYFEDFNEQYKKDKWLQCSEAKPYNLKVIEKWIAIRDKFSYTEDTSGNDWQYIDIAEWHTKYGCNYIFVDSIRKLWRIKDTASEFYGNLPKAYEF